MSRKDNKGRNLRTGEGQRKDGMYMYRYTDLTGKRQTVYSWRLTELDRTPKGKKEDVSLREKEEKISLMLKSGDSMQAGKMTLNELFSVYLSKKRRKGKCLAPKTKTNYLSEWNRNVKDTVLGNKKVCDICKADIISFYGGLLDAGLSYGTVVFFHKLLNSVFNYAMDSMEIIGRNPCRRALDNIEGMQKETVPLSKEQDKALLEYVRQRDAALYQIFLTMRETMVRTGECIAITKSDIDAENHTVTISRQLVFFKAEGEESGRLHVTQTKGRNIRHIPLKDNVFEMLQELAEKASDSVCIDGVSGFLFQKDGNVYRPAELRSAMSSIVTEYNLFAEDKIEGFTPKILRHTGCTMYAREGMDISVLQYILGHKSSYTTMRYYNHVTEERVLDTFQEHLQKND